MTVPEFTRITDDVLIEYAPRLKAPDRDELIRELIVELRDQGLDIDEEEDDDDLDGEEEDFEEDDF